MINNKLSKIIKFSDSLLVIKIVFPLKNLLNYILIIICHKIRITLASSVS